MSADPDVVTGDRNHLDGGDMVPDRGRANLPHPHARLGDADHLVEVDVGLVVTPVRDEEGPDDRSGYRQGVALGVAHDDQASAVVRHRQGALLSIPVVVIVKGVVGLVAVVKWVPCQPGGPPGHP